MQSNKTTTAKKHLDDISAFVFRGEKKNSRQVFLQKKVAYLFKFISPILKTLTSA